MVSFFYLEKAAFFPEIIYAKNFLHTFSHNEISALAKAWAAIIREASREDTT